MLIRGVVEDELGDDAQAPALGLAQETLEVVEGPVIGVDVEIVGNVVAVVPQRGGIEGEKPQRGDSEILKIIELLGQPREVALPVGIPVEERPDVQLVDDGVLVPAAGRWYRTSSSFLA